MIEYQLKILNLLRVKVMKTLLLEVYLELSLLLVGKKIKYQKKIQ
jgi:hypothetical protein